MNMTAEHIAVELVEQGIYQEYKITESLIKQIREEFRSRLECQEERRVEFPQHNLVAKFTLRKKYHYADPMALNDYLNDIGLLPAIVQISSRTLKDKPTIAAKLEDFRLREEHYVKTVFSPDVKAGITVPWSSPLEQQDLDELAHWFNRFYPIYKQNQHLYDIAKRRMVNCSVLKAVGRIEFKYGTLLCVECQPRYDSYNIFNTLGAEFLIEHGTFSSEKSQEYILNGILTEQEINHFRTVSDIHLIFQLLPIEVEKKMIARFQSTRIIASLNRQRS